MSAADPAHAENDVLAPSTPSLTTPQNSVTPDQPAATSLAPTDKLELGTKDKAAPQSIDPKDIPDILMQEVQSIENNCRINFFYSSFHDCRCIAVKFLDARLKSDPDTPKERVFAQVAGQCADEVGIAGFVYNSCAGYMKTARDDYESFCTCAANDVARAYVKTPVMNMRYIETLRRNAFINCGALDNPALKSPYAR